MKPVFLSVLTVALLTLSSVAAAADDTRYITDKLYVPLRSGHSSAHRIVHRGLPSGTEVTLLQSDEESGYSLVRTRQGLEGWLPNQYLDETPIARTELLAAQKKLTELQSEYDKLKAALNKAVQTGSSASAAHETLQQENDRLSKELEEIKRISANAITLDREYQTLSESNQMLKDQVDVLQTENTRLRENHENEAFLNGAFAVAIGVLIALLVPRLRPRKRSEWA